jgi:hypothetical protein
LRGFAADLYGEGKTASNPEDAQKLMLPLFEDRIFCNNESTVLLIMSFKIPQWILIRSEELVFASVD